MAEEEHRGQARAGSARGQGAHLVRSELLSSGRSIAMADVQTAKIGSLADVNESADAEGLRVFYYLVQDLKVCIADSIWS